MEIDINKIIIDVRAASEAWPSRTALVCYNVFKELK